jgi:hypothetical protein
MQWLANVFTKHPEMGVYLAMGIGYVIGRLKVHSVGLGAALLHRVGRTTFLPSPSPRLTT